MKHTLLETRLLSLANFIIFGLQAASSEESESDNSSDDGAENNLLDTDSIGNSLQATIKMLWQRKKIIDKKKKKMEKLKVLHLRCSLTYINKLIVICSLY